MNPPNHRRALALFALAGLALPAHAGPEAAPLSPTILYLRAGDVDTSGRAATTLAQAIATAAPSDRFILQLDGPITPERRAAIAAAGIRLGGSIPSHAYIARLHGADPAAASRLNFVRYLTPYRAEWKLDPELGRRPYVTPERLALRKTGRDLVVVTTFEGADTGEVERAIWSIRAGVIRESEPTTTQFQLLVEIPDDQVPALASIPGVQFVEPAPEVTPRSNYNVRWVVQGNQQDVFPLYNNGLRGEGQIVGILDGRIDVNHCSFLDSNPIGPTHRKIVAMQSTGAGNQHGTHVAGTAAGNDPNSANTANTRGVAYLGKIAWASYGSASATDFNTGINFVRAAGARIHTNSWGNDGTTSYDSLARAVDEQSYNNEDDLICFAVTNQSLLKNPENAKNVLAVGNTQNSPTQTTICTGGAGPTSDGRQKPEIWAPGCSTQSSQSGSSCGTVSLTGTSMASPAIAGTAMLVRQYYTQGYYPLGIPSGTGFTPSGALLRATLMNTGQDLTAAASGFQTPTGYPSTQEGWGRVRADDALYFPGDARKLLIRDVRNNAGLSTGGEETLNVNVLGSGEPLRITLTWTEPPASAGASQATVNDLDLIVEGPSGVYRGNVFNTAAGLSQTGGTRDAKNNTEQVHIAAPSPGPWTVRIVGTNVAQATQGYALVVTGDIVGGSPPPLVVSVPGGVPSLVPPGTPTDLTVRVTPGSQNVVPGSPTMHYRLGTSGSFLTQTLTPLTGNDYRATLPPLLCENSPQFYFTAMGDGGATASSPTNAPTGLYSTTVGTVSTSTVFSADFEQALPAGWTATGLWHTSNTAAACSPSGTPCAGPWAAYYGIEPPATNSCTFNSGAANSGLLAAPPIALPAVPSGGSITLTFCSALVTENLSSYDKAEVLVNGSPVFRAPESAAWTSQTVNLTNFAGQTINLAFRFDTVDSQFNAFRGWHVDDVRISATTTGCTNPPQACYANCDASTGAPLLTANDFQCFLNKFAAGDTYANCDGSTGSPLLTANDFQCFLNKFAAGCS